MRSEGLSWSSPRERHAREQPGGSPGPEAGGVGPAPAGVDLSESRVSVIRH